MQAWRRRPEGAARKVAATWSGVVCPWFRLAASAMEQVRTLAASGVSVCWIVLNPDLISSPSLSLSLCHPLLINRTHRK
ncbi:hypothetical protein C4D60_Mb03t12990 [Musa balbisiana]|uniref:Uncharacterized protein n=1 Tax=Musa balbisiana TaxID=52838 RepID=A0A4S8J9I5_MUSBA|nr:hypothetical protein C4D60_Mb03t12990 [Musa balbisiana]